MISIGDENRTCISVKDVDQSKFVKEYAALLKKKGKLKVPDFIDVVKSGQHKDMAPLNPDWFYLRCASVARRLYFKRTGVGHFSHVYGGNRRYGVAPNHGRTASRSVLRKCLQALEQQKLVVVDQRGGRVLTKEGRSELDKLANQIYHNTSD